MATFLRVMMARIRSHFRRDDLDRDFDQELAAHLAMAEEDKVRQGVTPEEARRAARVELGGLTQLREASREARGLPWLDNFWLDVKLGLRMLRKSWGLTLVGGLAMTVAIGISTVIFAVIDISLSDKLPLDEGDRVVALMTWDGKAGRPRGTVLPDFERWRDQLRSVEDVGAFRTIERNLVVEVGPPGGDRGGMHGPVTPVSIAEMTASGFELARVPPLLGRPLAQQDERDDANPVVVIGYDVWQSRFSADPAVLGRQVRLGSTVHTVIGVMPQDFTFPINHRFWTPFRPDRSAMTRGRTPFELVFARLVPGVTLEGARAELTTLGLLPAPHLSPSGGTAAVETDSDLHPRVVPYTMAFDGDDDRWVAKVILFFVILLLIPPCANIAILIYARTVTRQEEFAARYVLGASRSRIVVQLFIEVLVLAAGAAGVALVAVREASWWMQERHHDELPFWVDLTLSFRTILFAAALAVLAAVIAGAVPALKATGRQMQAGLRSLGSRTGMQLGATWTALIVIQVAFSAAALPSTVELAWGTLRQGVLGPGFAAEEYLTARLAMDREMLDREMPALRAELVRQLKAEPDISEVTVSAAVPGDEPWASIEVEGIPLEEEGLFAGNNLIRFNQVDEAFFNAFDIPVLTGRVFNAGDFDPARAVVVVNRTFAEQLMGETAPEGAVSDALVSLPGNLLGRRVRYIRKLDEEAVLASEVPASESGSPTWYEIVGIVADRPANETGGTMYHPRAPGQMHPASLSLRVASTPAIVANRLREITMALDPTLRVDEILPLDEIYREQTVGNNIGAFALAAVTLAVLLLSAAGIYALMSFTVNQRRREVGIRAALGAQPHRLLAGIFKRALGQLAVGAGGGVLVALLIGYYLPAEMVGGWNVPGIIPAATAFMVLVGVLATAGPARRGLRVEPIEELREG